MWSWSALVELVAPSRCAGCALPAPLPWCARCAAEAAQLRIVDGCARCGAPDVGPDHRGCWPADAPVAATVAAFRYRGVVVRTIRTAKLGGVPALWGPLGRALGAVLPAGRDGVTFVPTAPRRRRRRGADHTAQLAAAVASAAGLPLVDTLRAREHPDQTDRAPAVRPLLPDETFTIQRPVAGRRLWLVDDVLTTGGTVRAAAAVLRRAGAASVSVAVVARAGSHDLSRARAPADW